MRFSLFKVSVYSGLHIFLQVPVEELVVVEVIDAEMCIRDSRVYCTSVQLGIKWRVLGAVCGWIPFLNLFMLSKIIRLALSLIHI